VAEWLGVSPAWVLDHASGRHRPYLPSVKLGKAVRFRREDVEQFIEDCLRLDQRRREAGKRATASW
jgi:predicted DNA-binding transcriptional regulator AlpA